MWSRAVERAATESLRDSWNVAAAAAAASSTSASVGTPSSATTLASKGLLTSNVPSPVRHSPFT